MLKRIRRYLAFLIVFAFSTTSLTDLGVFVEDGTLEAAQVEQSESNQIVTSNETANIEITDEEEELQTSSFQEVQGLEKRESDESLEDNQEWVECDQDAAECRTENLADTSLEFVSYYVHKYQKLPPVYMTKKEASQLGWLGGGLGAVTDNKSIGGDFFGNYQGLLPEKAGRSYHECDIDTLGADSRGTKRLVYSNDGLMYYTEDHYETFQLLYSQWDSENLQIL